MENEPAEQVTVKHKISKLAIVAVLTAILPLFFTEYFLFCYRCPEIHRFLDAILFATPFIPVVLGGWSYFRIIRSNGKLIGLGFSIMAICLGISGVLGFLSSWLHN